MSTSHLRAGRSFYTVELNKVVIFQHSQPLIRFGLVIYGALKLSGLIFMEWVANEVA